MNLKEAAELLDWPRDQLKLAIQQGVRLKDTEDALRLVARPHGNDFDITDEELNQFIGKCEAREPGRHPPLGIRRDLLVESRHMCAICRSHAPLQYHHILPWERLKHHDERHMLAVCGTCHDKIRLGDIDEMSQRKYKDELSIEPKTTSEPRETTKAENVPTEKMDAADSEKVVVVLPRGMILLEDMAYQNYDGWSIGLDYCDFAEGWRGSTHYHRSYRTMWRDPEYWVIQYRKMKVPPGDWRFARLALDIAQDAAEHSEPYDVGAFLQQLQGQQPVLHFTKGQEIHRADLPVFGFNVRGSHRLRDVTAELAYLSECRHIDLELLHENVRVLRHEAAIISAEDIPKDSPSHDFISRIINEYCSSLDMTACKDWLRRLVECLSTATAHLTEQA